MTFLDPVLNPLLGWTLHLPPFLGIFFLSLIITLIINVIYKYTTDQAEMKRLKDKITDYQKQIKASRDNPKKMMKLNNEAMEVNMKYMGKSLKPTLYTFIPIIFVFAWMNANYTYAPMTASEPIIVQAHFLDGFTGDAMLTSSTLMTKNVTSPIVATKDGTTAKFAVQGDPGSHDFKVQYKDFSYNGTVVFGEKPTQPLFPGKGPISSITVDYPRTHPLGSFHLFSWYPGWLALYIVLSVALSMSTRKLMKIY